MLMDLTINETMEILRKTDFKNVKQFIKDIETFKLYPMDVFKLIDDYLTEYEPLFITDIRTFIINGNVSIIDNESLKELNKNDFYIKQIVKDIYLCIE